MCVCSLLCAGVRYVRLAFVVVVSACRIACGGCLCSLVFAVCCRLVLRVDCCVLCRCCLLFVVVGVVDCVLSLVVCCMMYGVVDWFLLVVIVCCLLFVVVYRWSLRVVFC